MTSDEVIRKIIDLEWEEAVDFIEAWRKDEIMKATEEYRRDNEKTSKP